MKRNRDKAIFQSFKKHLIEASDWLSNNCNENSVFSCVPFCLRSLGRFEKCEHLGNKSKPMFFIQIVSISKNQSDSP